MRISNLLAIDLKNRFYSIAYFLEIQLRDRHGGACLKTM